MYKIVEETMGGTLYWMIYKRIRFLFWTKWLFFERCNTPDSAALRLSELTNQ